MFKFVNLGFTAISAAVVFVVTFLFWVLFLNHVGINEIGVAYNSWDGSITVQDEPGWYVTTPVTLVTSFDMLPMKVELPSNAMVVNTKIVRFKKEGVQEYIRMQGFSWFNNDLRNVLMGYAFTNKEYPFMEILPNEYVESTSQWNKVSDGQ